MPAGIGFADNFMLSSWRHGMAVEEVRLTFYCEGGL
jgi:hypothetical protein